MERMDKAGFTEVQSFPKHSDKILKDFPYKDFRPHQKEAVESVLEAFLVQKKRFVALEGPVGSGKTVIAYVVSRFFQRSFFISTQRVLQEQVVREFKNAELIWSSANYGCVLEGFSCEDGLCRFSKTKRISCTYVQAKEKAVRSRLAVMNYQYLLNEANSSEPGSAQFGECDLLILDEVHNLEFELRRFLQIDLNREKLQNLKIPALKPFPFDQKVSKKELHKYCEALLDLLASTLLTMQPRFEELVAVAEHKALKPKEQEFVGIYRDIYTFERSLERYIQYYKDVEFLMDWYLDKYQLLNVRLIPKEVYPFVHDTLYKIGVKVLLMSGTLLSSSHLCKSVGISSKTLKALRMPSSFKKENRQLVCLPVGGMSRGRIDQILDKVKAGIDTILEKHKGEKGIIHVPNYKVGNHLLTADRSGRLMGHVTANRGEVLKDFLASSNSNVLVSPSMYEGLDLIGDASRFQVIVKIPWLSLEDLAIAAKCREDFGWYTWRTCIRLVQSWGRSVRSEDDYAITYILDSDFRTFFNRNPVLLPKYFREAVIFM